METNQASRGYAQTNQIMSDSIDQLATALAKAQGEFKLAIKSSKNPFFKSNYADFEAIIEASRPALVKYGLSVVQPPHIDVDGYLVTLLLHASGQWIKSTAKYNPAKNDIQSLSSYNTYLKRMCYTSLVGVATGDDDDGEAAMVRQQPTYTPEPSIITGYQHTVLMNLLIQSEEGKEKEICNHYGIQDLTKLPTGEYLKVKTRLESKLPTK